MEIAFSGELIEWRGPSPFYWIPIPAEECAVIKSYASQVSYGWGVIPVMATIGETEWKTSLMPKDGRYLLPVKDAVRKAEKIDFEQVVEVSLAIW